MMHISTRERDSSPTDDQSADALTVAQSRRVLRDREAPGLSFPIDWVDGDRMIADENLVELGGWGRPLLTNEISTSGWQQGNGMSRLFGHRVQSKTILKIARE